MSGLFDPRDGASPAFGATSSAPFDALDDPRVEHALEEYVAAWEAGRKPERDEFLARHPDLREALAECLDGLEFVHANAAVLRGERAGSGRAATGLEGEAPRLLGDFQIVREVGRGGMGVVYEAEQVSLGRRIALKVLPLAAALDPRQLQRFRLEAQAAALLRHPNIVPVYAVGHEGGVHYLAMQLIEGQNLAAFVRDHRRLDDPDRAATHGADDPGAPTTMIRPIEPTGGDGDGPREAGPATPSSARPRAHHRAVARVGSRVAAALDNAHQLGVIHRDIKPANILLDRAGEPWVTDFGVARLQDQAGPTLSGNLVGTLRYMSPEQALGHVPVDHRTDVYSLGATLYELLALRPAFDGDDRRAVLRQIAQEEPAPPRRHDPTIPRDLETIVLKAMAKEAADRYATAGELAKDLRRFLEDRPIAARREGWPRRAVKWARRHRPIVATAALAVTVCVAALAIGGVLVRRQRDEARAAYADEARHRARAERNLARALEVLNQTFEHLLDVEPRPAAGRRPTRGGPRPTASCWTRRSPSSSGSPLRTATLAG